MDGLRALAADGTGVRQVRGKGLLIGIDLDRAAGPVVEACREAGLLVLTAGDRVLRLTPPLIVQPDDCRRALDVLRAALRATAR